VLVLLADSHAGPTDDATAHLRGRTATAVAEADRVCHAGDHATRAALDGLRAAAGGPVGAVHGNADETALRESLPAVRVDTYAGALVVTTHTHEAGATGLATLGRSRGADLVVFGHSHRPTVAGDAPTLCNPGSHAAPRGGPATHAELRPTDAGLAGEIRTVDGETIERFDVATDREEGARSA
jgi:putative phosphoesterase